MMSCQSINILRKGSIGLLNAQHAFTLFAFRLPLTFFYLFIQDKLLCLSAVSFPDKDSIRQDPMLKFNFCPGLGLFSFCISMEILYEHRSFPS